MSVRHGLAKYRNKEVDRNGLTFEIKPSTIDKVAVSAASTATKVVRVFVRRSGKLKEVAPAYNV
jgi:hypothetical protein